MTLRVIKDREVQSGGNVELEYHSAYSYFKDSSMSTDELGKARNRYRQTKWKSNPMKKRKGGNMFTTWNGEEIIEVR